MDASERGLALALKNKFVYEEHEVFATLECLCFGLSIINFCLKKNYSFKIFLGNGKTKVPEKLNYVILLLIVYQKYIWILLNLLYLHFFTS